MCPSYPVAGLALPLSELAMVCCHLCTHWGGKTILLSKGNLGMMVFRAHCW